MKWFRMHHEARTDKKLAVLTDRQHRIWFDLLCFASEQKERGVIRDYSRQLLAVEVANGDVAALEDTLVTLVTLRCISLDGDTVTFLGFQESQQVETSDRPCPEVWKRIREQVFQRDNFTCRYCRARGVRLECDHVIPVSRGGSHDMSNLVTACFRCNRSKRAKTPEEWRQ